MAHRYTRRKSNGYIFWSQVAAGAVVLFPLSLSPMDYRASFARGLSVAAYKASPAFAAFEDANENYVDDVVHWPQHSEPLTSGTRFVLPSNEEQPRVHQIALRGLVIREPARLEPKAFMVAGQTVRPMREEIKIAARQPRQLYADETPTAGISITSVSARAQELVQREMQRSSNELQPRYIASQTGTQIYVGKNQPAVEPTPLPLPPRSEPKLPTSDILASLRPSLENQRPLWLNGQIEMTGGLAFVGPETQIVVKRILNGESYEHGRIWITEGKFEIHVKEATGFLVAELFTRDGRVLGRGEINLLQLADAASQDNHIQDLRIALRPITDTAALRAVSGYSYGQHILPVPGARIEIQSYSDPQKVNEDGTVSEPSLVKESSFVARASAMKTWPSLVVGQAVLPQDIRLFSNSLIEALVDLALTSGTDRAEALHHAIVWGQAARDGQPLAGAQVELAGYEQPIYFDEHFLPDPRLTATSKTGLFAFLKVRSGVQALRIKASGRTYPAAVFPTEDKHVSYVEFDVRDKIVSQFKVTDVLDLTKPVSARIKLVGMDALLSVTGDDYVEYGAAANTVMVEADAGPEYEISRTTLAGSPNQVHLPVISRRWLEALATERDLVRQPDRGSVVGFVDDQDFEIEMTGYAPHEQMQIVYFDAKGKALSGTTGVAGGGFAIFNAPAGLQTVFVHPIQSRETYSQIVVAEPSYVHVLAWSAAHR